MADLEFRITEIERRLANLIRVGTVQEADYPNARVRVASGDMLTGWLPWLTRRAGNDIDWWAPETGEQVILFSPSGDPAQGVVLPAIYQTAFPAPANVATVRRTTFGDGTVIEYDRAAGKLLLDCVGDLTVNAAGNADLVCQGKTTIKSTGTVEIDGGSADVSGVVTQNCVCAFTGLPHADYSTNVTASKG